MGRLAKVVTWLTLGKVVPSLSIGWVLIHLFFILSRRMS
jgi:hypothetical protein